MIFVYLPDMLLQVEVPAESLPANVAVEGFHRKVRVHVETQVRHLNIYDLFLDIILYSLYILLLKT